MNLKKLIELGYFPKELPPPFETDTFAQKSRFIKIKWEKFLITEKNPKKGENKKDANKRFKTNFLDKYGSSSLLDYSYAKGPYSRRKLSIPNPKQFLDLGEKIVENWNLIRDKYALSPYSESSPIEFRATRTVRTKSESWNDFRESIIEKSLNKRFELKIDIAQFYPTIYTHSITWAFFGKEQAKNIFRIKRTKRNYFDNKLSSNAEFKNFAIIDQIDTLIRNCNERQSVGLPIGPDTSFIIAELLTSRLDNDIAISLSKIKHEGLRFYDDYFFYFDKYDDAEFALKKILEILNKYQLDANENKISINSFPFLYEEAWVLDFFTFKFTNYNATEIKNYFTLIFNNVQLNKEKTNQIINYSLKRFERGKDRIKKDNWDLFLTFLLNIIQLDPSSIKQVFKILLSYEAYLTKKSKSKISNSLSTTINDHLNLNHSYEVSWALWGFKSFKLKCKRSLLDSVLKSNDPISKLIALDLFHSGLCEGRKLALKKFGDQIIQPDLYKKEWLFAYESYIKGWLNFNNRNLLNGNKFFKMLDDYDVSFYNPLNQVTIDFKISDPKTALTEEEIERINYEDEFSYLFDISGT